MPVDHERLKAMLAEANARMDAAQPRNEPYVSADVPEEQSVGLYTDEERAQALRNGRQAGICPRRK